MIYFIIILFSLNFINAAYDFRIHVKYDNLPDDAFVRFRCEYGDQYGRACWFFLQVQNHHTLFFKEADPDQKRLFKENPTTTTLFQFEDSAKDKIKLEDSDLPDEIESFDIIIDTQDKIHDHQVPLYVYRVEVSNLYEYDTSWLYNEK